MENFEEKLNKIKVRKATDAERNSMWLGIIIKRENYQEKWSILSIFNFKKHMIGALIALLIIVGGGGTVAAANSAVPGDALFGLDLAVEKARINFTGDDSKKNELKVKFAQERLAEAKTVVESRGSVNVADIDLSGATVTEVEVDVFTNETTVKIEASDRHYGFITTEKEQAKIVDEIEAKYKLTEASILAVLSFETENRESRADDKGFLNSSKSEKEDDDLEEGLNSVSDLLSSSDLSAEERARLDSALNEILVIMGNNPKAKFKFEDGNLKIEIKKGEIEIKNKNEDDEDDNKGHGNDDDGEDDDNPGQSTGINVNVGAGINFGGDKKEKDDEVFCRGEWRDADDCDDSDDEDEDSNDSDDSNDDDSDDDNEDDDDGDEDDNSGSGNGGN